MTEKPEARATKFRFPTFVEKGDSFPNIATLRQMIYEEANKANDRALSNTFTMQFHPNRTDAKIVRLVCKYCSARLNFKYLTEG